MTIFHLVQSDLAWEDIDFNLAELARQTEGLRTGVIILPEMFSTGFSMASEKLAESMSGKAITWLRQQATSKQVYICGSLIIKSGDDYYNRFVWVFPDGTISTYDKRHLFRMAGEHHHYASGSALVQVTAGEFQVRPQVCYDLRFPVWSRNTTGYDVLLYVANWPSARRDQWLSLLQARAIENLCYVIAVNRVGQDGNQVAYSGDSCVIDPTGHTIVQMGPEEGIESVELDLSFLQNYRESFPAHLDADSFGIKDF